MRRWVDSRISTAWRRGWEALLDLVFPRDCENCGGLVESEAGWEYLCGECARRLDWIHAPYCETCGHPFPGIGRGQRCDHCENLEPIYASGRCCLLHREVAAGLVRRLKYHGARHLRGDLQQIAARLPDIRAHVAGALLVPVPLHPTRLRERGFNQSAFLAHAWSEVLPVAGVEELLRRQTWTDSQTRLARMERRRNVRDAFALCAGAAVRPDLTYVVVDDVFTTGSTLNECCRVLHRAGARSLRVLTLAHG